MRELTISIKGPIDLGPSWSDLDNLLRSMFKDEQFGKLVRIARLDGQANYRDITGRYDADFRLGDDLIRVHLEVN